MVGRAAPSDVGSCHSLKRLKSLCEYRGAGAGRELGLSPGSGQVARVASSFFRGRAGWCGSDGAKRNRALNSYSGRSRLSARLGPWPWRPFLSGGRGPAPSPAAPSPGLCSSCGGCVIHCVADTKTEVLVLGLLGEKRFLWNFRAAHQAVH